MPLELFNKTLFVRLVNSVSEQLSKQADELEAIRQQADADPHSLLSGLDETSTIPPYLQFLNHYFPQVASKKLAPSHVDIWEWIDAIEPGEECAALVKILSRGGAKSTTAELGVAYIGAKLSRRFGLYVSETQDQADNHVASISSLFETMGMGRSVNKYGSSRGWRRNILRTANGFNVQALGLDTAARGIKLDEFRPDFIVLDDIDNREDTAKSTAKKIRALTNTILPAGSTDVIVLAIQNLIIESGVFAKLANGTADFLLNRITGAPIPAVYNLEYDLRPNADGLKLPHITGGTPSWPDGQPLSVCEAQMRSWGVDAFLREAQHEVDGADGIFFKANELLIVDELPELNLIVIGIDTASTEGGGDWTVSVALGRAVNGTKGIIDLIRGQWGTDQVESEILDFCERIYHRFKNDVRIVVVVPQDPGSAGKLWAKSFVKKIRAIGLTAGTYPVTKAKAIAAKGWQRTVNEGNGWMVRAPWNEEVKSEHKGFREDQSHDHDDIIDGCSSAENRMERPGWGDAV